MIKPRYPCENVWVIPWIPLLYTLLYSEGYSDVVRSRLRQQDEEETWRGSETDTCPGTYPGFIEGITLHMHQCNFKVTALEQNDQWLLVTVFLETRRALVKERRRAQHAIITAWLRSSLGTNLGAPHIYWGSVLWSQNEVNTYTYIKLVTTHNTLPFPSNALRSLVWFLSVLFSFMSKVTNVVMYSIYIVSYVETSSTHSNDN